MTDTKDEYRRGRHVVYEIDAHVVLVTKYRRGAISDRVREVIVEKAHEVCARHDVVLREIDGEDDHIHLLVSYPPRIALSTLVSALKSNTAKAVRETGWSEVRKTGMDHFWSPSYFAVSVGGAPLDRVAQYIRDQRKPPRGPGRPSPKRVP